MHSRSIGTGLLSKGLPQLPGELNITLLTPWTAVSLLALLQPEDRTTVKSAEALVTDERDDVS